MTATAHIFEGTRENFRELVVENSARGPVLVHFWADWAGPCRRLFPVLADLAREYGGRFLLVNLSTDAQSAVAREYGVNSVPTVKLFRGGEVLEARIAVEPGDCEARFNLAPRSLVADDYQGALAQLLEIVERDRTLRQDIGRRGMLAVFALLGSEAELIGRYRPLLFRAPTRQARRMPSPYCAT